MKAIHIGDPHFSDKCPVNRLDENYLTTLLEKLIYVLKYAKRKGIKHIFIPGDILDSPSISWFVINNLLRILKKFRKIDIYIVLGQHDLYFRNLDPEKSAIGVLLKQKNVHLLGEQSMYGLVEEGSIHIHVCGISYGEGEWFKGSKAEKFVEDISKSTEERYLTHRNMLIIHTPLGKGKKKHFITDMVSPEKLVNKYPYFDVIHTGDYHSTCKAKVGDCYVLNPGALVRKTTSKEDLEHRPLFFIYDSIKHEVKRHFIPIQPVEKIFNLDEDKIESEVISEEFIAELKELEEDDSVIFRDMLVKHCKKNKISDRVVSIFDSVFEKVVGEC